MLVEAISPGPVKKRGALMRGGVKYREYITLPLSKTTENDQGETFVYDGLIVASWMKMIFNLKSQASYGPSWKTRIQQLLSF